MARLRYPAIIEAGGKDYGVWFPGLPGIVAMGHTLDEAFSHAEEALKDYLIEAERDGVAPIPPTKLESVDVPVGCTLAVIAATAAVATSAP